MKNITSKITHNLIFLIMLLAFNASSFGQALHWLSKPQSQVGPVVNGSMSGVKISANGRFISFRSSATNHVNQLNVTFRNQHFVYDIELDKTVWIDDPDFFNNDFLLINRFSAPTSDGQLVAFNARSTSENENYLYTKNLVTGEITLISEDANGDAFEPRANTDFVLLDDGSGIDFLTDIQLVSEHTLPRTNVYRADLITGGFTLLSIADDESEAANSSVFETNTSPSGRYVAFSTRADNLTGDTVTGDHIYLRDTQNQSTELISVQPDGAPSVFEEDPFHFRISVSNTGHVVHNSNRNDLVTGDNNDRVDLFLYHNGSNQRISFDNGSGIDYLNLPERLQINATGNIITFLSSDNILPNETNLFSDPYQYDIINDEFTLIETNFDTLRFELAASASGQKIILSGRYDELTSQSSLSNLFYTSLFLYDALSTELQQIEPVAYNPNTSLSNVFGAFMSADQRYSVFSSSSPNLLPNLESDRDTDTLLYDRDTATGVQLGNKAVAVDISPNGRYVLLSSGFFQPEGLIELTNDFDLPTLFLHDRDLNTYIQIAPVAFTASVNDAGLVAFLTPEELTPADDNGEFDAYLFNPADNSLSLISQTMSGEVSELGVSSININNDPNAVSLVFTSSSSNLIIGDVNGFEDVFVADWPSGIINRVSQTTALAGGNSVSDSPDISDDGQTIAFVSYATNLTNDITSGEGNVYLHDRNNQSNTLVSRNDLGVPLNVATSIISEVSISGAGNYIGFRTREDLEFLGDLRNDFDVFLIDVNTEEIKLISQPLDGANLSVEGSGIKVYEDTSVSPTRVGVSFIASGRLTELPSHPNYREAFLYQEGGPNVNLNIDVIGTGQVGGSFGISCMTNCDSDYSLGTVLSLVATADSGYVFDRWNSSRGQCIDDVNPCLLTMDQDKTIQAIFGGYYFRRWL